MSLAIYQPSNYLDKIAGSRQLKKSCRVRMTLNKMWSSPGHFDQGAVPKVGA